MANLPEVFLLVSKKCFTLTEDRAIWGRAGGDLSLVALNTPGKGQWFEAIRLIEQGGGGAEISLNSLTQVMLEDFSQNEDLLRFFGAL